MTYDQFNPKLGETSISETHIHEIAQHVLELDNAITTITQMVTATADRLLGPIPKTVEKAEETDYPEPQIVELKKLTLRSLSDIYKLQDEVYRLTTL